MKEIPKIQQQPKTIADTAIHYGYVAFQDILVGDRNVQPDESPYRRVIPCRELIPFTNLNVPTPRADVTAAQGLGRALIGKNGEDPTVERVLKTAKECVEELAWSYEEWGFLKIAPLTGFTEDEAFLIMQAIQPHPYKLKDLMEALEGAEERINATELYVVEYGNFSVELQPLPLELKTVAHTVAALLQTSAKIGVDLAEEIEAATRQKMETFFATGEGKKVPDPLDKKIFEELGKTVPTRLTADDQTDPLRRLADIMANNYVRPAQGVSEDEVMQRLAEKEAKLDAAIAKVEAMGNGSKSVAPAKSTHSRGDIIDIEGVKAEVIDTRFDRTEVRLPDGAEMNI